MRWGYVCELWQLPKCESCLHVMSLSWTKRTATCNLKIQLLLIFSLLWIDSCNLNVCVFVFVCCRMFGGQSLVLRDVMEERAPYGSALRGPTRRATWTLMAVTWSCRYRDGKKDHSNFPEQFAHLTYSSNKLLWNTLIFDAFLYIFCSFNKVLCGLLHPHITLYVIPIITMLIILMMIIMIKK